jgi:hypothetical protein
MRVPWPAARMTAALDLAWALVARDLSLDGMALR